MYTQEQLTEAVLYLAPTLTYALTTSGISMPEACKIAAIESFIKKEENKHAILIREALVDLKDKGQFCYLT